MNNLLAGIMTKLSGSQASTAVGGRIYLDRAPEDVTFPYIVFFIVSEIPDDTFTELMKEVIVQFSIFSLSQGAGEIADIYGKLNSLFHRGTFSITSNTLVQCVRQNFSTMVYDITTEPGYTGVKHWVVDYMMTVRAT